jgi:RNA-directed DNA polymerase
MLKGIRGWLRRLFSGGTAAPAPDAPSDAQAARPADAPPKSAEAQPGPGDAQPAKRSGPLKPNQRRNAVRDQRLMPKPQRRVWSAKPPRVMSTDDGKRLFGDTLRTRNKDLRTLATDRAQLARHALPIWDTEADVAEALGLSLGELRHFAIHRSRERVEHYVTYAIAKRSGGQRIIHAPKARLKAILRRLQTELVRKLPVSDHAHGFVVGRSVRSGAEPHVGKRVVMRLDLREFFPTVTAARVRGYLIALGYGYPVAATLAVLATEPPRQRVEIDGTIFHVPVGPRTCVQGAPTSPGLCNAILYKLDRRIAALARRAGFAYTRYADDITLSGDGADAAHRLRKQVERVIREEGFEVNTAKTRVTASGGAQRVTGVTVNRVLGLSRKERRKIRAMLHRGDPSQQRHVDGLLAWVKMLNPDQAEALRKQAARKPRPPGS